MARFQSPPIYKELCVCDSYVCLGVCVTGHRGRSFRVRDISSGSNIRRVDAKNRFFGFFEKIVFSKKNNLKTLKNGVFRGFLTKKWT